MKWVNQGKFITYPVVLFNQVCIDLHQAVAKLAKLAVKNCLRGCFAVLARMFRESFTDSVFSKLK